MSNTRHPSALFNPVLILSATLAALLTAGCANMPGGGGGSGAAAPAGAGGASSSKPGPGMNDRGEVVDSRQVQAGQGQRIKGQGGWEGEITGKPVPGSKFSQLSIGMTSNEAQALLGPPSDFGAHPTAKNFIPFYYGADKARYEAVYKGQGRLLFASSAGNADKMHLIWIIHSASEGSRR